MSICKPALGTAVSRVDMNWRKHYGSVLCKLSFLLPRIFDIDIFFRIFGAIIGGKLKSDKAGIAEMMTNIRDAEGILSKRKIDCVNDLNLGDLALFLEVYFLLFQLPFFYKTF